MTIEVGNISSTREYLNCSLKDTKLQYRVTSLTENQQKEAIGEKFKCIEMWSFKKLNKYFSTFTVNFLNSPLEQPTQKPKLRSLHADF